MYQNFFLSHMRCVCRNLFLSHIRSTHQTKAVVSGEITNQYVTPIKLYNQEINKNVPLVLKNEGIASWYMCGPTVYDHAHIGHASCYIKFDIIRRIMENVFNIGVISLMGITDIDDKIIQKSKLMNITPNFITKKYEADFFDDMKSLNVLPPTGVSRVTENIPLIISFCECLITKDFAYVTSEGNVYFMVSKVDPKNSEDPEIEEESSIDPLKRDVRDFALWKRAKLGEPSWESPWGRGRPGWHIECSAMASSMFGSFLDIHSGGMDLKFPHHANEQSQSEAYHGKKPWVNYWLHAGLLHIPSGDKMSKSLGNIITIKAFLSEHTANDFRILCLQSPYRNSIHYTQESLSGAKGLHKTFHNFINDVEAYVDGYLSCEVISEEDLLSKLAETKHQVESAFSDDFSTSRALLCLINFVGLVNKCLQPSLTCSTSKSMKVISACAAYVDKTLEMLGVEVMCKKRMPRKYVFAVDAIVNFRNEIRLCALKKVKKGHSGSPDEDSSLHESENDVFIKAVESLKINLSAVNIDMKDDNEDLKQVLEALCDFIEEVECHMRNRGEFLDSNNPLHALANSESAVPDVPSKKHLNRSRGKTSVVDILKACDNFRTALNDAKLIIKDKGHVSYWSPMEDIRLQH